MKARDVFAAVFGRSAKRSNDAATAATPVASPGTEGTGAPRVKLALGAFVALALTLIAGVALAGAVAPVLTIEDATSVEYTTAHVKGEVNPEDHETDFHFEWVTDQQFTDEGNSFAAAGPNGQVAGRGSTPEGVPATVEENLADLQPATKYHLRLVAENTEGEHAEAIATSTFTTKAVAKPLVTGLAATETHFSGMVNPNAPEENALLSQPAKAAYATHWSFTCNPGCNFSGPSEGDLKADDTATEVTADPTGLTPNQAFDVTLHATNAGGETTETKVAAFTTPAVKPAISSATLTEATPTSIILKSLVNPHNATLTDCHFAYGAGLALDQSAPCGSLPGGEGNVTVSAPLAGLEPGTEYHFQLIATNSAGTTEGDLRAFTTPTGSAGPQRHYERVSPAEKGDGDIIAEGEAIVAARSGDGVTFESRLGFADTTGSGTVGRTTYLGRRAPDGSWSVHAITPQGRPESVQIIFHPTNTGVFSEDLSSALVWGYDLPASSDDTPDRKNLYLEDTATRALRPLSLSQVDPLQPQDFSNPDFEGISADAKHVAFVTGTQMLPDAAPGAQNVYQWDDGVLSVAGILPDSECAALGRPSGCAPPGGAKVNQTNIRGTMSSDGSRLAFFAPADFSTLPQLYLRIDGNRTALVSESENPAFQLPAEPEGVAFEGMTPDGRNVFFVTDSPLLAADTAPGPDLYRWTEGPDPAHESNNLTLITNDGAAVNDPSGFGEALVGMSNDGRRVYVTEGNGKLALWNDGVTSIIDPLFPRFSDPKHHITLSATGPGYGRVSPDGNWLAYINSQGGSQMYLYDRAAETDTCVSCPGDASLVPTITHTGLLDYVGFRPRFLSDDGRVFFTSTGALVPQDTNGVADVYEYDGPTGTLNLISSGKGSEPSEFADASASGDDVFIVTRQQLVASDNDEYADLYDVRVGPAPTGPPTPQPSPCQGEACQSPSAGPPPPPPLASSASADGNPGQRRCGPNKRKVRGHGKTRCVNKHHARTAKHKRRNSR